MRVLFWSPVGADNELPILAGIVDVSYVYDKMYVIRPNFPVMTLLAQCGS